MVSRLGYASTKDGYHIDERLNYPIFEPANDYEKYGCEDPRVTVLNGICHMTYTVYGSILQIGMISLSVETFLQKNWLWEERFYPFPTLNNKNAVIFPKNIDEDYIMLHRIEPNIHISYSKDLRNFYKSDILMKPRDNNWDNKKIGAAGPPIEIEEGWLQIYHGVDRDKTYRLGAAILEKETPEKIIFRTETPFLEPKEDYECHGWIHNVVFSCGAVLLKNKLIISYGCADTVIGVSTYSLNEII